MMEKLEKEEFQMRFNSLQEIRKWVEDTDSFSFVINRHLYTIEGRWTLALFDRDNDDSVITKFEELDHVFIYKFGNYTMKENPEAFIFVDR